MMKKIIAILTLTSSCLTYGYTNVYLPTDLTIPLTGTVGEVVWSSDWVPVNFSGRAELTADQPSSSILSFNMLYAKYISNLQEASNNSIDLYNGLGAIIQTDISYSVTSSTGIKISGVLVSANESTPLPLFTTCGYNRLPGKYVVCQDMYSGAFLPKPYLDITATGKQRVILYRNLPTLIPGTVNGQRLLPRFGASWVTPNYTYATYARENENTFINIVARPITIVHNCAIKLPTVVDFGTQYPPQSGNLITSKQIDYTIDCKGVFNGNSYLKLINSKGYSSNRNAKTNIDNTSIAFKINGNSSCSSNDDLYETNVFLNKLSSSSTASNPTVNENGTISFAWCKDGALNLGGTRDLDTSIDYNLYYD
ncbi:hypothetical protein RH449_003733 [Providencia stuartii]|uniref:hypothetical protein n=1 Tax=Providencia stuartii TaxID=588 RepID=UPI002989F7C7|nr:hypothetical protein [Providencia stuartii]HEM8345398.1 hypothetical protein [Providencia stuartii]